jgi:hypothetical protein
MKVVNLCETCGIVASQGRKQERGSPMNKFISVVAASIVLVSFYCAFAASAAYPSNPARAVERVITGATVDVPVSVDLAGHLAAPVKVSTVQPKKASLKRPSGHKTTCSVQTLQAGYGARQATVSTVRVCG